MSEALIDRQWQEIIPPPAMQTDMLFWIMAILFVIVLFSLAYAFYIYLNPKRKLLRRLHRLHRNHDRSSDERRILVTLDRALCGYFRATHLVRLKQARPDWQELCDQITHYQYQSRTPEPGSVDQLVRECIRQLHKRAHSHAG